MNKLDKFIPPSVIAEIVDVLEFGDIKHPGDGWVNVLAREHFEHALNHLDSVISGESIDKESGCHHMAHAIVRLMFTLWTERAQQKE